MLSGRPTPVNHPVWSVRGSGRGTPEARVQREALNSSRVLSWEPMEVLGTASILAAGVLLESNDVDRGAARVRVGLVRADLSSSVDARAAAGVRRVDCRLVGRDRDLHRGLGLGRAVVRPARRAQRATAG